MTDHLTDTDFQGLDAHDETAGVEPIAVIGMAARVAGAANVEQLWQNLLDGVEPRTTFSRSEQIALGADPDEVDDPDFVSAAFVVDKYDEIDAGVFGMTGREAELADPQQRLLLEMAHTALENAGVDPARFAGDIGVYAGGGASSYGWLNIYANPRVRSSAGALGISVGNSSDYLATNVSYKLNLRGPSLTVTTACSTSLVATHLACEALRNLECDLAVAGGTSIELPHGAGYVSSEGYTSPDGHVRPFDAAAAGTMWGSGAGAVVLKRLADAVADGDAIRGVILGTAINNDGATKVGFSAPSVHGQLDVVRQALAVADVEPRSIGYVEAHGTGTSLGDPIEVTALSRAFSEGAVAADGETPDRQWCAIGSIKSNIGHLSQAAGVISLIKATLVVERGLIPPSLNYRTPNPAIDFDASPFYVAQTLSAFDAGDAPRRASVSSFGIGGTNAHLVVQEPPRASPAAPAARPAHLLQLSANTETALTAAVTNLTGYLTDNPAADLGDVAGTLRRGRTAYPHRTYVVATDAEAAVARLAKSARLPRERATGDGPAVTMLFSGQGSQYAGMGAELYEWEPTFRAAVDDGCATLTPEIGVDLRTLIFAAGDRAADEQLRQTQLTQPALFVVEYALARMWQAWGVRPAALLGHSIGEYVAATVAGVFELPAALRLVATRGRLMQSMPAGSMLAVQLGAAEVAALLPPTLEIATVNGPGTCVVGGPTAAIDEFAARLEDRGVGAKALRTSHAFHTAAMEPILAEFRAAVAAADPQPPTVRLLSNLTGTWATPDQVTDPAYWADQLRHTVRFGDCVATVLAEGPGLLLECGPGRQLAGLARMQSKGRPAPLTSLPAPGERGGDVAAALEASGRLWATGVPVDAADLAGPSRTVALPGYPYERSRYFVERLSIDPLPGAAARAATPDLAEDTGPRPLAQWFAVPSWRQLPPRVAGPVGDGTPGRTLVFAAGPQGRALVAALRNRGERVTEVVPNHAFSAPNHALGASDQTYAVNPSDRGDYEKLLADFLGSAEATDPSGPPDAPLHVVHAWALDLAAAGTDLDAAERAQEHGFYSLLAFLQAVSARPEPLTLRLSLCSVGAETVIGNEEHRPEQATLAGISRVAGLELPSVTVRRIDLEPTTGAERLADELAADGADRDTASEPEVVALRRHRRWTADFDQTTLPAAEAVLRPGGRYLITGGTGGIGITLARDIAERYAAHLVLLARTPLPERAQWATYQPVGGQEDRVSRALDAIAAMEAAGATVEVVAADVTDPVAMRALAAGLTARLGGLDGIVHAAGLPGGGMVEVKSRADAEVVLAPKLRGTLALKQAFGTTSMDFVVLCSSITSVVGGFGQVDYCAANAYLDAEAAAGAGWSAPVLSLNWGGWSEVGMAAEVNQPATLVALRRGGSARALDHPILHTAVTSLEPGGAGWAEGKIGADTHWPLAEHRIGGDPVLPGTGLVELARAAFAACHPASADDAVVRVTDLAFVEPLRVPDGQRATVRVEFEPTAAGVELRITSDLAGNVRVHAQGAAEWVAPERPAAVDVAGLVSSYTAKTLADEGLFRSAARTSVVSFGPRWAALADQWLGADGELARIQAPAEARADDWVLHPALLDVATAYSDRGEGSYLPLSYGEVTVFEPLPAEFYSVLTYRGEAVTELVSADLLMVAADGRVLVQIADFALRRIDPAAISEPAISEPAPADPAADSGRPGGMIAPADGVQAFYRVLAADLGPQIVINPVPVAQAAHRVRSLSRVAAGADDDGGPGGVAVAAGAPGAGLEAAIAQIWSEVLGVAEIGPEDDFFDLGGNSLVAVQLIGQVRRAVGVRLPMRILFDAPTVREMAETVQTLRAATDAAPVAAADSAADPVAEPPATPRADTIPRLERPS